MGQNKKSILMIAVLVLAVVLIAIFLMPTKAPTAVDYGTLMNEVSKNNVVAVKFTDSYHINILYKSDVEDGKITLEEFQKNKKASATAIITYRNDFILAVEKISSEMGFNLPSIELNDPTKGSFMSNILPYLSFAVIIGLGIMMFFSMRGGKGANSTMNFGKSKAKLNTNNSVKFNDVAGAEEEKDELKEVVDFLKNPKKYKLLGARIPKGVLLVGPPGTGKTLFAKAVAGEAGVPFFSISGSDFVEMFVGVGASRVRDLFAQAQKSLPCIVFIDEIDAVGRKRGAGMGGGNDEREQTLNQLLVQMDGFEVNSGIIIMAATNRADVLDPALLRPGRFDRQIFVNIPDVKGREAIFKVHSRNKPLSSDVDFKNLARLTSGFSGADIENLLNESAILAARDSRNLIIMKDVLNGINKVIAGPQKKSRVITEVDKRITAYHESGHAIVGKLMKHCDPVQEVSIIPRGMAAGYTISRPDNDNSHVTKNKLLDNIAMMLGGRAAEQIVIQDISTGASQDIKRATAIARSMVTEWGMSDALPNVFFGGEEEVFIGRDYQTQVSYSNDVAKVIDDEIRGFIDKNFARAMEVLKNNESIMHNMVKLLYERETIYGDEVDMLMNGSTVEEILEYIKQKQSELDKAEAQLKAKQTPLGNVNDIIVKEDDVVKKESLITETDDNQIIKTETNEIKENWGIKPDSDELNLDELNDKSSDADSDNKDKE